MEDLQQSLCPLKETFLNSRKTFSLLFGCLRVLDNLIQHRFVLPHCLITQVSILSLISKDILDALSFERSLFLCPLTAFTLVGKKFLLPFILCTKVFRNVTLEPFNF